MRAEYNHQLNQLIRENWIRSQDWSEASGLEKQGFEKRQEMIDFCDEQRIAGGRY